MKKTKTSKQLIHRVHQAKGASIFLKARLACGLVDKLLVLFKNPAEKKQKIFIYIYLMQNYFRIKSFRNDCCDEGVLGNTHYDLTNALQTSISVTLYFDLIG